MDIYNVDVEHLPSEQLETYIGIFHIKQEHGKQIVYHTKSSTIVLGLDSITKEAIFSDNWRLIATKVVNKDNRLKSLIEQSMYKTKSLLDGIASSEKFMVPWMNQNDEIVTLSYELEVVETAQDGTAFLTIGRVTNESIRKCKTENDRTLRTQNKLLRQLNDQAIELNSLLVFSIDMAKYPEDDCFTCNSIFRETLGLKENKKGYIPFIDFTNSQTMDIEGSTTMKELQQGLDQLSLQDKTEFTGILVKHQHLVTGKTVYLTYSARLVESNHNQHRINGYAVNNTDEVLTKKRIELLNKANRELQVSQNLAVKSGKVLIWYQNSEEANNEKLFYGNDQLFERLGIKEYQKNRFLIDDFNKTILFSDEKSSALHQDYIKKNLDVIEGRSNGYSKLLVKHINHMKNEVMYFEHNLIVEDRFENGAIKTRGGYLTDVTKETEYRLRIEYLVQYDTVTNLHNRHYFEEYTNHELPKQYTVIVIDIDGLKFLNDAFGHIFGDHAIKLMSNIIKNEFKEDSKLFRIGGDEFVVITTETSKNHIQSRIKSIHNDIAIQARQNSLLFSASVGFEINTESHLDFASTFTSADNIMYRNKLAKRKDRKTSSLAAILDILYEHTNETHEQYLRLRDYAKTLLQNMGYNRRIELEEMDTICKLHNIGKIILPKELIKNEPTLSKDEQIILQSHPEASYKIVKNLIDNDVISQGILHHHEQYDGKGYPMGLTGENIPLFSRILYVIETFDRLLTEDNKSVKQALNYLQQQQGVLFDPEIVKAFCKIL